MKNYIGRCYVECVKTIDGPWSHLSDVYFKNFETAKRFAYYWTKRCGYYCRIFEYNEANYFNDFKEGFDYLCSYQNGKEIASNTLPLWCRLEEKYNG
ncbi:MAG: hypothetical protein IKY08_02145 [Firmicutes bacterium]|nr:hypothetical protein [Bacillota bacterium]